jgi:hypothetical protein
LFEAGDVRKTFTTTASNRIFTRKFLDRFGDVPVVRTAEMYLIRAEALGRSNGLADLNTLRTQRGLAAISPAELPNDAAYLQAILGERRAEFNFEGHRYFDLARTQQIKAGLGIDDFHGIMPIPNRELTVNTALKQNPGYVN